MGPLLSGTMVRKLLHGEIQPTIKADFISQAYPWQTGKFTRK